MGPGWGLHIGKVEKPCVSVSRLESFVTICETEIGVGEVVTKFKIYQLELESRRERSKTVSEEREISSQIWELKSSTREQA